METSEIPINADFVLDASSSLNSIASEVGEDGMISLHAQLPSALQESMTKFIEKHPNWDQYRLIQAAISGFLVQNGNESRDITRLYIGNMFGSSSMLKD
tara:strand:- start:155 stop:451 length:297 start_codon:yes stop_codon:yes gene_type:complete